MSSLQKTPGSFCAALLLFFVCVLQVVGTVAQQRHVKGRAVQFKKHILSSDFISEGTAIADVNRDGRPDIIAGAFWFENPRWLPHGITRPRHYDATTEFSNSFLNFALDVDQDGWTDQVRISLPGEEVVWYENPAGKPGFWKMHLIIEHAGNESPAFVDIDGDGRPDILCNDPIAKEMIWLKSPAEKGDTVWRKFVIDGKDAPGTGRYTHGLGWADMNGDGRKDVIVTKGWWECPSDPTQPNWLFHPADLGEDCSQIFALDVHGNGSLNLVSASAHDYGIWWHTPSKDEKGNDSWKHHIIYNAFSETHALAMADINGDGYPDLITGKRYFAHNGKDPGGLEPAVLYWFQFSPGDQPRWIPHLVDDNSGVGLQVLVQDMNNDGLPDIVVANKKGVFFFEAKK